MGADFVSIFPPLLMVLIIQAPLQWGFVSNLVKVFPSLATRPLHLTGESYAGTYIVKSLYQPKL